jgi:hypothetical protein
MNLRPSRLLVALGVTGALVGAACGTAKVVAPPLAVREAARSTFDQGRVTFTVTLNGSDSDIAALFGEGEAMSAEDRKALDVLRDSRLTLSIDQGENKDSTEDDNMAFDLTLGGIDHAVELRVVDGTFYARADVAGFMDLFEAPPGALEEGLAAASEAGFGFLREAAAGRWLSTDLEPLNSFAQGLQEGSESQMPGFGADAAKKLMEAVSEAWGSDVQVERLDSDQTGDRYRLSIPLRRLFERLLPAFSGLPGFPVDEAIPPAGAVPDKTVAADVWVRDGKVVRGEFDLAQLADHGTGPVALRIDVSPRPDPITAPSGAVKVDLLELFGRFAGLGGTFES